MSADEFSNAHLQEKLEAAADSHDFGEIEALVAAGASPDSGLRGFKSLLIYAVAQGQRDLTTSLLSAGASTELADDAGNTPLMHAARLCLHELVVSLLEGGANPLAKNSDGQTAFDAARAGAKDLTSQFNDTAMSVDDLENSIARYGRIAGALKEAEEAEIEAAKMKEIAACRDGLHEDITVRSPLRLKTPGF
ncbi:MAG: ankyrin repeat domain-containing protein [Alphaproteobacteria bacterium]|nr:MAG: ankyrin repeat domain-containing protein [Alphaproteobacteria bacterium]